MDAAKYFCVSKPGLIRARTVITKGVPELETAVRTGQVSVSAAAEVAARHPPERQREILAAGPAAVIAEARKGRVKPAPQPPTADDRQRILALADTLHEMARRPSQACVKWYREVLRRKAKKNGKDD